MKKLVGSLLAVGLPALAAAQITIQGSSRQISTNPAGQFNPAISGNVVAYTDLRNGNADVYFTDLATGSETQVTNATGTDEDELADVSGDTIVYVHFSGASSSILGSRVGGAPLNNFNVAVTPNDQQTNPGT